MDANAEYDDWRKRYDAAIAAYEAMAERRAERRTKRREQARSARELPDEDELERRYLAAHSVYDPFEAYFRRRMAASRLACEMIVWAFTIAGNAFLASVAARMARRFATEIINHAEKLLWRTRRKIASGGDARTAAERERRKIRRRSTLSPQPQPDDVRRAWLAADSSVRGIVAFGAVVHDLECYVDNSLVFDEAGNIVGRASGVLGWLRENVPELAVRYKTIMRYKSIAKRCRQFLGIEDPRPLDPDDPLLAELLAGCPATQKDVRERLDEALAVRTARTSSP